MKKVLFISYDGMTDPLGQSQILPYICGLSQNGYSFSLLSCEKPARYEQNKAVIEQICKTNKIEWTPVPFHTTPPIAAKFYDIYQLRKQALKLYKQHQFDLIHCRSYVSVEIGLWLKKKFGVKVIFDMRGFWVDERVDGGLWDTSKPFYKLAYNYYKKKEAGFIQNSDQIISLTEAGKGELQNWKSYQKSKAPITVIPCSADFNLFSLTDPEQKEKAKQLLGIDPKTSVVSYLGSLGTWYMLDEMLAFFKVYKSSHPDSKFLFLTPEDKQLVYNKLKSHELTEEDVIIRFAQRKDVPLLMKASDLSLSFIKPAYSKISSSPTKLGELLAMGIPVICNNKVGDVEQIIEMSQGGLVLREFSNEAYKKAVTQISALLQTSPADIRANSFQYYDLNRAVEKYTQAYGMLLGTEK